MPMQMGSLMVTIRAQDFASRTLRRVSSEMQGLSRQQQLSIRQQRLAAVQARQTMRMGGLSEMQKGLQNLRDRLKTEQELSKLQAAGGRLRGARGQFIAGGPQAVEGMSNAITRFRMAFDELDPAVQRAVGKLETIPRASMHIDRALRGNAESMRILRTQMGITATEMAALQGEINRLPLDRLDRMGHAMGGVGRTMQLFGAVTTVALGAASHAYADFNEQVVLAATQTRDAGQSFSVVARHANVLTKYIEKLMLEFPATAEEMSKAAYDIYSSMTVSFKGGQTLLREFNKVAVAGGVDLVTATNASISVLENFDNTLRDTGKITQTTHDILNRMFAIIKYGRMNFAQFNSMLSAVIPAAKGAGQSFDDISGAMAILTRHIPSQRVAAVALARLLDVFSNVEFQRGMEKAERSITKVNGALLPLPQIMEQVATLPRNKINQIIQSITALGRGAGRGTTGTMQARRALQSIIPYMQEYRQLQFATTRDNDEYAASFSNMANTLGVRWKVFMNQLRVLVLYIGEQAIPVFLSIGETIRGWVQAFQRLSPHTRGLIVRFVALAGVASLIGGVILSIVGSIVTLAAALMTVLPKLKNFTITANKMFYAFRGLASFGLITIGIELVQMGGGWKILGALVGAAGIGGLLRGGRGAIAGPVIALGATLAFKGNGWQSKIGQLLMAAGGGFAFGGPAGAVIGTITAGITIALQDEADFNNKVKTMVELGQKTAQAAALTAVARNVSAAAASREVQSSIKEALRKQGLDITTQAGQEAALKYLQGFMLGLKRPIPGGPRDNFVTRMAGDLSKMAVPPRVEGGLRGILASAKSWTQIQAAINNQLKEAVNQTDKLAINIARAYSQGNASNAINMLQAFVKARSVTVSDRNIIKLITDAVARGDVRQATDYMQQYSDAVKQGKDDLKQYAKDMKQYAKDVADYHKEMAQAAKDAAQQVIDNMRSMYENLYQQNQQAMGELFQGPFLTSETFDIAKEWGITPRAKDILKDMSMQLSDFTKRNADLARLARRGLPKGMLDELRKLPPDQANPLIEALGKASPGELRNISRKYQQMQNAIKKQTKIDFKSEMKQFRDAGLNMATALTQGFESAKLQTWFDNWAKNLFPGVINAAVNQAIKDFKAGRPITPVPVRPRVVTGRPTVSPLPQTTTARTYAGGTGAPGHPLGINPRPAPTRDVHTGATYNYTFNQHFHGEAGTGKQIAENAKKSAFHARNATKGRMRG